jgi:hypothetical protein
MVAVDAPELYLGGGIKLQVSDTGIATVFGYDECPKNDNWLFGSKPTTLGCTKITGHDTVNVRLIHNDGSVNVETWSVSGGTKEMSLTRPNGFQIRELDNKANR